MGDSIVLLVSCGKRKSNVMCQAQDMYNSPRFQKLKSIAEKCELQWFIMSAKHGLLSPDCIIEPYDKCLANCSIEYQKHWAKAIFEKLCEYDKQTVFFVLANEDYSRNVVSLLTAAGYCVVAPFISKEEQFVSDYVAKAVHIENIMEFYNHIYNLAENTGGIFRFSECNGRMLWPKRGVYFIVDFHEKCLFSNGRPRIVRIGTHAVSNGSKSTLWNRLKTHKGTGDGGGNHRGSIFRLHVGNAIIKKEGLSCDTWGVGQNAGKETREKEQYLEKLVSEYIGQLGVIVLDVDDLPSSTSARAYIEKNSIALISSLNSSFNFSTLNWLGAFSPRNEIRDSCLWNINYISSEYDPGFMQIFEQYVDESIRNYKSGGIGNGKGRDL